MNIFGTRTIPFLALKIAHFQGKNKPLSNLGSHGTVEFKHNENYRSKHKNVNFEGLLKDTFRP